VSQSFGYIPKSGIAKPVIFGEIMSIANVLDI
jgi:hypothetical protein